jgi:hypothetical protein
LLIGGAVIALAIGIFTAFFITMDHGLGAGIVGFICAVVGVAIYLLPAFIAHLGGHPRAREITLLNFLAGWLVLGWLAALIWALVGKRRK